MLHVCEEASHLLQHGLNSKGLLSSSLNCGLAPTAAELAALASAESL